MIRPECVQAGFALAALAIHRRNTALTLTRP